MPLLMDWLRRLEYRGYDSAGVAVLNGSDLHVRRRQGKLEALDSHLTDNPVPEGCRAGIAHTRWATHGPPNERNAHPHADCAGRIAVIHNGIIENHTALRAALEEAGHVFASDTDTEVLAHLVEAALDEHPELEEAVAAALRQVQGAYAVVVIDRDQPGVLVAGRLDSPLVLGVLENGVAAASDAPALLAHTRDFLVLENEEVARLAADGWSLMTLDGEAVERETHRIEWDAEAAEKGGYEHFMLKEIEEQADVMARTAFPRMDEASGDAVFEEGGPSADLLSSVDRVLVVACGTSFHAGHVAKFWLEELAQIRVEVDYASESRGRPLLVDEGTLVVSISQSGETADTIGAVRRAQSLGAKTLTICNVRGSTLMRESDAVIRTHAGPEIGVASTKAFVAQLVALYLLAVRLGRERGILDRDRGAELLQDLRLVRPGLEAVLDEASRERIRSLADSCVDAKGFLFLGRGINFPIALEGALKLKEISYIHAEGYPAGEMKHGPIALIHPQMPVLVVATPGDCYDKVRSNFQEVLAREGRAIALCAPEDMELADLVGNDRIEVPVVGERLSPILNVVPLQLFSYYVAHALGREIDQPRNLAKSVTVE